MVFVFQMLILILIFATTKSATHISVIVDALFQSFQIKFDYYSEIKCQNYANGFIP